MARLTHPPEKRELVFRVWRECGQNATETLRKLGSEHGWPNLSRSALFDWITKHDWNARAARLQAEEERAEVAKLLGRERILADLDAQKRRYEEYFRALEGDNKIDNSAVSSYANLCKTMMQLQDKIESGAGLDKLQLALDVVRQQSRFVRETYPQHLAAFIEIMEPFGERLVDIYG